MAIKSHAFGRVTLTEADANKFQNQVKYGKPKAAAVTSVKRGVALSKGLRENGSVKVSLKRA